MKTHITKIKGDWQDVVDGCRVTVAKPPLGHEPSSKFKWDMMIAEHEPIREIWIKWKWFDIPYCIAMHWKTHIWPSRVPTSREDRTGIPRNKRLQTDTVDFEGCANPQHLIDSWRKRLCYMADPSTREYAEDHKIVLSFVEPEISNSMVPNCVYRCGCPEPKMCENHTWLQFKTWCKAAHKLDVEMVGIKRRYELYNEWFYLQMEAKNERTDENASD